VGHKKESRLRRPVISLDDVGGRGRGVVDLLPANVSAVMSGGGFLFRRRPAALLSLLCLLRLLWLFLLLRPGKAAAALRVPLRQRQTHGQKHDHSYGKNAIHTHLSL